MPSSVLALLTATGWPAEAASVSSECSWSSCDWSSIIWPDYNSACGPLLLSVRFRVTYKLATVVNKCLHGPANPRQVDGCVLVTGRQVSLRSADSTTLVVPRTCARLGHRAFSAVGPRTWNSLPTTLWDVNTFIMYRPTSILACSVYTIYELN